MSNISNFKFSSATISLIKAADDLENFLGKNCGDNADWPIRIVGDEDSAPILAEKLEKLRQAIKTCKILRNV